MRSAAWAWVFFYASAACAGDAGPLRDLNWGSVPSSNGIAYTGFDVAPSGADRATAAALQANGDVVMLGYAVTSNSNTDIALTRVTPLFGLIDTSFGSNGRLRLGTTQADAAGDLLIQPDGKILYAVKLTMATFSVGRLLANGTEDPSFDFDGHRGFAASAFLPLGSFLDTPKLLLQPDGKIVIAVSAQRTQPDLQIVAAATRLNTDGSTDTGFGGQGTGFGSYAPPNGGTAVAFVHGATRLAGGQLLLAGSAYHAGGSVQDVMTLRLSADGVPDAGYGSNGFAFIPFDEGGSLDDAASAVAVDAAGRAVVSVNFTNASNRPRAGLARFTTAGQPDATFGTAGRVLYEVRANAQIENSTSLAVLPDGRILVAGTSSLCLCGGQLDAGTLTMFLPNGQINPYFGAAGTEHFGDSAGPDEQNMPIAQLIVSGDYAYVAGSANNVVGSNNQDFATARVAVPLFRSGFDGVAPAPL